MSPMLPEIQEHGVEMGSNERDLGSMERSRLGDTEQVGIQHGTAEYSRTGQNQQSDGQLTTASRDPRSAVSPPEMRKLTETPHLCRRRYRGCRLDRSLQTHGELPPGEDGIINAPRSPALDVLEAGGSQERPVLGGGPLPALRLHQHVQRVQLRGPRAPSVCIQEAFDHQDAAAWDRERWP